MQAILHFSSCSDPLEDGNSSRVTEKPTLVEKSLALAAAAGDARAVALVLERANQVIYPFAIRFLADPDDASDATQEALLAVARGLSTFRGDSEFGTWMYRVAVRQLLRTKKRMAEQRTSGFAAAEEQLDAAWEAAAAATSVSDPVLVDETRLFCTHGMLLCLNRPDRAAYILCEILDVPASVVAEVLDTREDALRKRLSRARTAMNEFMRARCGLLPAGARCRCERLAAVAVAQGLISPDRLRYSTHPTDGEKHVHRQLEAYATAVEVFRSHPSYVLARELRTLGV